MAALTPPIPSVTIESLEPRATPCASANRAYLWDVAFSKLEIVDPVAGWILKDGLSSQPSLEVVRSVIDSTNEKQMKRANGRWQISLRKNGASYSVNMRDKAMRIIECFAEYKGYVDNIVDLDPTGYGELSVPLQTATFCLCLRLWRWLYFRESGVGNRFFLLLGQSYSTEAPLPDRE